MEGCFQEEEYGQFCEKGLTVDMLKKIEEMEFEDLNKLAINKDTRLKTLELLLNYYKLHIQGYKTPKSLPILTQIFN